MRKVLLAALWFAISAQAVDVAGKWWGDAVLEDQEVPVYVTLVQEGNIVKGTGGPTPTNQDLLTNGRIVGNRITFDVMPSGRSPLHFNLISDATGLKGTVKASRNGQPVTGKVSLRRRST